jgi:hypothetical protein
MIDAMTINGPGNVGIGTGPVSKLHVLGTATLGYATANAITSGMSAISNASAFNNIGAARLTSNFGGAVAFTGRATELVFTGDNGNFGSGGGFAQGILGSITAQSESGNAAAFASSMIFYTTSNNALNERLRITSGGQFLFGRTDENMSRWGRANFYYPSGVSNATIALQNSTARAANNLYGMIFADNTDETNAAVYVRQTGTNNGGDLLFGTNAGTGGAGIASVTERMRITAGGNVGIGITSPGALLHVQNSGSTGGTIQIGSTTIDGGTSRINLYGSDNYVGFRHRNVNGSNDHAYVRGFPSNLGTDSSGVLAFGTSPAGGTVAERMRINSAGQLCLGTTSSLNGGGAKLSVQFAGSQGIFIATESQGAGQVLGFNYNITTNVGSVNITATTTSYATSSDYRLKNVTGPITTSGAYIDSLNPVEGTWKVDGSTFIGLVAHEVQAVSRTEIVNGEKDGEVMQAMDYSSAELIANLIAEVKALRMRVATLESNSNSA